MKIISINCGSSSLKFTLFNMTDETLMVEGVAERIGLSETGASLKYKNKMNNSTFKGNIPAKDHSAVLNYIFDLFVDEKYGVIKSIGEIKAVGHRVLHGKDIYKKSMLVTDQVLKNLKNFIELGPLHMPHNIHGIEACKEKMPQTPMVAVFDTSFHQTMDEEAYLYALPYEYYEKYGVRRYGFHGTSHKFVAMESEKILNKPLSELNLITLHIGNGASATAIKKGKVIDTSMGFTPLEGLMMGTRCGDIDPAIIPFLMHKLGIDNINEIDKILNKKSGLLGLSQFSNDMRDILKNRSISHQANIAYNVYIYRISKYVGSYFAAINDKIDAIILTAGICENSIQVCKDICDRLKIFGIKFDISHFENNHKGVNCLTTEDSEVPVYVIPTNEELMIAKDTYEIYKQIKS